MTDEGGDAIPDSDPDDAERGSPVADTGLTRREAIRRLGTGGAGLLGAGLVAGSVTTHAAAHAAAGGAPSALTGPAPYDAGSAPGASGAGAHDHLSAELPAGDAAGPYGGPFSPPGWMDPSHLDRITFAPAPGGDLELDIAVTGARIEVANGTWVDAWLYGGTAPGPTIRATEGEVLRVRLRNATDHDHNLHFHGRHSPLHDGWEPVPPGGETVYEIEAGPAGVHPYHCHTMPIDQHIARGLYGVLIVDPPNGRPPAHEVVLVLGGWDPEGVGQSRVCTWNGVAGFYEKFPIKIPAGEPIRVYLVNMLEYEPVASFHLHAQVFDVYPSGAGDRPSVTTDVITLGQTERAILELTLPAQGRYMFHPHQHHIASRGAMGWFAAI